MSKSIAAQLKERGSNGSKVVRCIACDGEIQPYAGRPVSLIGGRFAHHPGQCPDAGDRAVTVRDKARQGELFAWSCRKVEPAGDIPSVCDKSGTDRAEYEAHMRGEHGLKALATVYRPIRLRKTAPATLPKPAVANPLKYLTWHEVRLGAWQEGIGNPVIGEADRRGQYWSDADTPHSIWVVPLAPAPWEPKDRAAAPVQLYDHGDGRWSMDWSAARRDRGRANRRAKDAKAAAA